MRGSSPLGSCHSLYRPQTLLRPVCHVVILIMCVSITYLPLRRIVGSRHRPALCPCPSRQAPRSPIGAAMDTVSRQYLCDILSSWEAHERALRLAIQTLGWAEGTVSLYMEALAFLYVFSGATVTWHAAAMLLVSGPAEPATVFIVTTSSSTEDSSLVPLDVPPMSVSQMRLLLTLQGRLFHFGNLVLPAWNHSPGEQFVWLQVRRLRDHITAALGEPL